MVTEGRSEAKPTYYQLFGIPLSFLATARATHEWKKTNQIHNYLQ